MDATFTTKAETNDDILCILCDYAKDEGYWIIAEDDEEDKWLSSKFRRDATQISTCNSYYCLIVFNRICELEGFPIKKLPKVRWSLKCNICDFEFAGEGPKIVKGNSRPNNDEPCPRCGTWIKYRDALKNPY